MKKKLLLMLSLAFFVCKLNAQTQFGFFANATSTSLKSDNFNGISNGTGFSLGLSALSFISTSSDFIVETGYGLKKINIKGYKDFNDSNVEKNNITIHNISVSMLFHQYIIIPEADKFHFGLLAGLGTTVVNTWEINDEENLLEDVGYLKPFYILGISGGTEKFRVSLRYNQQFFNALSDASITGGVDENNFTEEIALDGKLSFFSLGITWYLTNFLENEY